MKAIEIRAALIAANDMNLNGADALVETAILKQLIESCKARVEELDDKAKALAEAELAKLGGMSSKFEHSGHHFTLDRERCMTSSARHRGTTSQKPPTIVPMHVSRHRSERRSPRAPRR